MTRTRVPAGASNVSPSTVKRAAPLSDDVELLELVLVVGLDHEVAGVGGGVRVRPERADAEVVADRVPDEALDRRGTAGISSMCVVR